jgi:hypothetical protein
MTIKEFLAALRPDSLFVLTHAHRTLPLYINEYYFAGKLMRISGTFIDKDRQPLKQDPYKGVKTCSISGIGNRCCGRITQSYKCKVNKSLVSEDDRKRLKMAFLVLDTGYCFMSEPIDFGLLCDWESGNAYSPTMLLEGFGLPIPHYTIAAWFEPIFWIENDDGSMREMSFFFELENHFPFEAVIAHGVTSQNISSIPSFVYYGTSPINIADSDDLKEIFMLDENATVEVGGDEEAEGECDISALENAVGLAYDSFVNVICKRTPPKRRLATTLSPFINDNEDSTIVNRVTTMYRNGVYSFIDEKEKELAFELSLGNLIGEYNKCLIETMIEVGEEAETICKGDSVVVGEDIEDVLANPRIVIDGGVNVKILMALGFDEEKAVELVSRHIFDYKGAVQRIPEFFYIKDVLGVIIEDGVARGLMWNSAMKEEVAKILSGQDTTSAADNK